MADEKLIVFANFLKQEFHEYAGREIRKGHSIPSQSHFAQWIGVSPTSLSNWINGLRPPVGENVDLLATRLGMRVYEILDIPPRAPKSGPFAEIAKRWHELDSEEQRKVLNFVCDLIDAKESKQSPPS
ncbi:MAG TPA: helix-turn-helix transcriptional regulator [Longilinea sp.]|nr:helix-turn-helix transcriptional regulator [Longilinea sp.]